jgi:mono/diheme cytochrome c family protein
MMLGCAQKTTPSPKQASVRDTAPGTSTRITSSTTAIDTLSYEQRQGRHLYTKYCVVCHGDEGKGDGFNAFNLDPKPRDFTDHTYMDAMDDARLLQTIAGGGRSVNRSSLMPSWGGRMNKEEMRYLLVYLRLFRASK